MKTATLASLLVLALAACQPAAEAPAEAAPAPAPVAAEPAAAPEPPTHPGLVVETLDDGTFDLAAQRGGWVVVNFWATWCKPCLKEIPDLSAFDASRDDVRVIGLAYEEIEPDDMRAFLKEHPAGYPIALLDVYDPPGDFETPRGLPMTYLIDPEGKVAKKYLGPITSEMLAADIAAAGAG
ncbi:TlpA family protein disulfide reductase [Arenimonas caeni]|jgi:thiol-disulfide isomerase/thioredoxin|uniref:Thioredoxin n=1 Tax=Arenimonas caeni TaxID=2058085 RepID=A0A2P6M6J0_9GAMM|nr:TlpA disulfide reductase family protein [Arenimonas caeni]MDY0022789.1 TlpA disulfide reductase family protein [Arenimonas caeni]PRH81565.1 thioredoxin [Arenimonas caeni]